MRPFLELQFGNPASKTHSYGWEASAAVERAREQVAGAIGARPRDLIFTSGATEANNLALLGSLRACLRRASSARAPRLLTCRTEHRAVLDPAHALRREGVEVVELPVDRDGRLEFAALERELERGAALVSIMHANNETGVVQDLERIVACAHAAGALVHSDAAQSLGKLPFDLRSLELDLASFSAHKIYGPKGIGALFVRHTRPPISIEPLLYGGGQERGLRSGTLAPALCAGFGEACAIAVAERESEAQRLLELRAHLAKRLAEVPDVYANGDLERRLPGNLHVSFDGIDAEALLLALPDVALSTGSACTSAKREPSHVLLAMGLPRSRALGSVRIGLGRGTTLEQLDAAVDRMLAEVRRLRELRPRGR